MQNTKIQSARTILTRAVTQERGQVALLSSMQKTAGVIMFLTHEMGLKIPVIFGDTGVHYSETLQIAKQYQFMFGFTLWVAEPRESFADQNRRLGELWRKPGEDGYKLCCRLRKKEPLISLLQEKRLQALIAGLMQSEGDGREDVRAVQMDAGLACRKYHPLWDWTSVEVDQFVSENSIPIHDLHGKGFASIGCSTCTTAVKPGEHPRAGRWRHLQLEAEKRFCGLNAVDA